MATSIATVELPEEREYARYLREIEDKRWAVAERESDLFVLQTALAQFDIAYHARVGILFIQLDRVRLSIDQYEVRISLLKQKLDRDPHNVEETVRERFIGQEEQVRISEAEAHEYERAHFPEPQLPELDVQQMDELRMLFRSLARRFHPDLARTEVGREIRGKTMQRINAAYTARNLAELRQVDLEGPAEDAAFDARSLGERLVWAIREVARLSELIAELDRRAAATRESDLFQLWERQEAGHDVLTDLQQDIESELVGERGRLSELILTYRQLL